MALNLWLHPTEVSSTVLDLLTSLKCYFANLTLSPLFAAGSCLEFLTNLSQLVKTAQLDFGTLMITLSSLDALLNLTQERWKVLVTSMPTVLSSLTR